MAMRHLLVPGLPGCHEITGSETLRRVTTPEISRNVWIVKVERVMGIEPTPSAWEAEVLPLNYTRTASRFSGVSAMM